MDSNSYTELQSGAGGYIMISYVIIVCFLLMNRVMLLTEETNNKVLYNMSMVACLFWIGRIFTRVAERPGMYFMFAFYVMMGDLILISKNNKYFYVRFIVLLFPLAIFIYRNINYPYDFIFGI